MAENYYIKVEAVNIYGHISDTNQISIVRGGSYLLKSAIEDIAKNCDFSPSLKELSSGASVGVFLVLDDVEGIKQKIINFLNEHNDYKHFTFVVSDTHNSSYLNALNELINKGRKQQLRQLSESPDDNEFTTGHLKPSSVGGLRVGANQQRMADGIAMHSELDACRFSHGKKLRQAFYQSEIEKLTKPDNPAANLAKPAMVEDCNEPLKIDSLNFTDNLKDLASHTKFNNLNNKMAVIYFDGNNFSHIQQAYIHSKVNSDGLSEEDAQIEFDVLIKSYRRMFLYELLKFFEVNKNAANHGDYFFECDGQLQARLETLIWGGDEILLVVPAWLGMDVLQLFYRVSQDWKIGENRLTHAGGIVFTQCNSPINKIQSLAIELADSIKNSGDSIVGRRQNYYDYLVLESIDYPTEALNDFFKTKYDHDPHNNSLSRARQYLKPSALAWDDVQADLPKSQFHRFVQEAVAGSFHDNSDAVEQSLTRLNKNITQEQQHKLNALFNAHFTQQDNEHLLWPYIHFLELWDYLSPQHLAKS